MKKIRNILGDHPYRVITITKAPICSGQFLVKKCRRRESCRRRVNYRWWVVGGGNCNDTATATARHCYYGKSRSFGQRGAFGGKVEHSRTTPVGSKFAYPLSSVRIFRSLAIQLFSFSLFRYLALPLLSSSVPQLLRSLALPLDQEGPTTKVAGPFRRPVELREDRIRAGSPIYRGQGSRRPCRYI